MDVEETKQFESREEIVESLKEKRDLSGADMSGLELSGHNGDDLRARQEPEGQEGGPAPGARIGNRQGS